MNNKYDLQTEAGRKQYQADREESLRAQKELNDFFKQKAIERGVWTDKFTFRDGPDDLMLMSLTLAEPEEEDEENVEDAFPDYITPQKK